MLPRPKSWAPRWLGPVPQCADRAPTARLSFALPPALILRAQAGRYGPSLHQVGILLGADGVVEINGYHGFVSEAMPALLDQAARFLLTLQDKTIAAQSFEAECVAENSTRPERFLVSLGARVVIAQGARALLVR